MSDLLDPTTATSPAFNRKAFVGLSAGAAAAASAVAPGSAQSAQFGKPHAPIVAENDPAIEAHAVVLSRPNGGIAAYAAWPKLLRTTTPGIVMVQHVWGVDSTIRDDVRRYAKAGYICIAPNLYSPNAPSGDGSSDIDLFRPLAAGLQPDAVTGDLLAARNWVIDKATQAKVGITGFCMGGGIALRQLFGTDAYAAAAIFYGPVRPASDTSADPLAYAAKISTPIRGNYGERDTSIAPGDVRAVFDAIPAPHELSIYTQAGHAFFDDTRASYVDTAAADAWTKTLAWFARYLA